MSSSEAFSSTSAMLASAERICQFYLRGRCQRENCDFKHDPEKLKAAKAELAAAKGAAEKDNKAEGAPVAPAPPVTAFKSPAPNAPGKNNAPPSVMSGGCGMTTLPYKYFVHVNKNTNSTFNERNPHVSLGRRVSYFLGGSRFRNSALAVSQLNSFSSADSIAGGSGFDDESIASGFTDMTAVNRVPPKTAKETAAKAAPVAEKVTAAPPPPPPPTTDNGAETPATADAAPAPAAAAAAEKPVAEKQPEVPKVANIKVRLRVTYFLPGLRCSITNGEIDFSQTFTHKGVTPESRNENHQEFAS